MIANYSNLQQWRNLQTQNPQASPMQQQAQQQYQTMAQQQPAMQQQQLPQQQPPSNYSPPPQQAPPPQGQYSGGGQFQGQNQQWYAGFDPNKQYSADSAKGTFLNLAQKSGINPTTLDKVGAEQWFRQHVMPGMQQAGFQVDQVRGDKAFIRTRENPNGEWVDYLRASGSSNPNDRAFQWGAEGSFAGGAGGAAGGAGGAGGFMGGGGFGAGGAGYGPGMGAGFSGGPVGAAEQSLLMRLLQNPESLSPDVVAQMKGVYQDQLGSMQQQGMERIAQNAASRGLQGGGWQGRQERGLMSDTIADQLRGFRDVDIQAAQQNKQDILRALGAGNAYMSREQDLARQLFGMNQQQNQFNTRMGFDYTQLGLDENARQYQQLLQTMGQGRY